jgi:WD40 repeat protein
MEYLGEMDMAASWDNFIPTKISASENQPILSISTRTGWLIVYDIQKEKCINVLLGHSKPIRKILCCKKTRTNFFTLGADNMIILWRYAVDKWVPRCFAFNSSSLLKDDNALIEECGDALQ